MSINDYEDKTGSLPLTTDGGKGLGNAQQRRVNVQRQMDLLKY